MLTIVYHDDESARECRRSICVAIRGAVYKLVCAFATWRPKYINKQHHVLGAYVIAKQQNKKKTTRANIQPPEVALCGRSVTSTERCFKVKCVWGVLRSALFVRFFFIFVCRWNSIFKQYINFEHHAQHNKKTPQSKERHREARNRLSGVGETQHMDTHTHTGRGLKGFVYLRKTTVVFVVVAKSGRCVTKRICELMTFIDHHPTHLDLHNPHPNGHKPQKRSKHNKN